LRQSKFFTAFLIIFLFSFFSLGKNIIRPKYFYFTNGFRVKYFNISDLKYSKVVLTISSGEIDSDYTFRGLAEISIRALFKGSKGYSSNSVKKVFLTNGVMLDIKVDLEKIEITASLPTKNIENFLRCLSSSLSAPYYYSKEINIEKDKLKEQILSERKNIKNLIIKNIGFFVLGKGNPYSKPYNLHFIDKIGRKEIRKYYENNILPSNAEMLILSSINPNKIKDSLKFFKWRKKPVFRKNIPSFKRGDNSFIETKNKKVTVSLLSFLPGVTNENRYAIEFFTHLINGYFGSRANIYFAERGLPLPETYLKTYQNISFFALQFELNDSFKIKSFLNELQKFKDSLKKDFPTKIEYNDAITSFIGKKFLLWQSLEKYYKEYLFFKNYSKLKFFDLKYILLKTKKKDINKLLNFFLKNSILIISGNEKAKRELKGFYRLYSTDDF